jgi:flavodoxin
LITHEKKLDLNAGIEEDLQKFTELMEPLSLSGKLGCILIQLPPRFDYKPKELEDFFKILPTHIKFAVEFRDRSWMRPETWALLEKHRVAYTIVDEPLLPPELHVTSDIAYFRWHGRGTRPWYNYRYDVEELKPWIPKVKETTGKVSKVYGYFNNHYHGYAVENCLQVLEMLGALTPKQKEAKARIQNYRSSAKLKESKLEAFIEPSKMSFEDLMEYFVPRERLKRAEGIEDSELKITKQTDSRIEATVREYHIVIDLETKEILHDCADWSKTLPARKLCKHVGKLLLSMDRDRATRMLRALYAEKESWQFKPYI